MRRALLLAAATRFAPACATQRAAESEPPATPLPMPANFKLVPPAELAAVKLSGEPPRLPDEVKIQHSGESRLTTEHQLCVAPSGSVATVMTVRSLAGADDAIKGALLTWRFQPQPTGVCSRVRFVWTIGG